MEGQQSEGKWEIDEHVRNGMHVLVFYRPGDQNPCGNVTVFPEEVELWKKAVTSLTK